MPLTSRFTPCAVFVMSVLSATPAAAQQSNSEDANELEVITVQAQKRTQNLQQVPVSVTSLSGKTLIQTVSNDIYDLQGFVPGFSAFQSQSATNSSFSIRGIGTSSQNFGFESSVGLYVDGVYRPRQNSIINNLVDIAAVEILRGPQGTLFGKNTPSGAVTIQTKAPQHGETDGIVTATLGNYQQRTFSGAGTITLIEDVLSARVSGFASNRDGWVNDANLGADTINDRNRSGIRVQTLYTPSDALSIRVIADYSELEEYCCAALTWQSNFQATEINGKFGTDAALSQPPFNATIYNRDDFYTLTTSLSQLPYSTMQDRGVSIAADYHLDQHWQFYSLSAWRRFDSLDQIDTDFSNADLLSATNDADQHSFSQELRLHYNSDSLNLIAGLYYFDQQLDLDYAIRTHAQFPAFFGLNAAPLQPLVDGINQISLLTAGLIAPVAEATPAGTAFAHIANQDHDSKAVFVQVDWQLAKHWALAGGLRYTKEHKSMFGSFNEVGPGINGLPLAPQGIPNPVAAAGSLVEVATALQLGQFPDPTSLAPLAPFQQAGWGYYFLGTASVLPRPDLNEQIDDDQLTGNVKLSWTPNRHQLWYASYATGYKSGGINTDRIAPHLDPVFAAETTRSTEVGVKLDLPDQHLRVNLSVYDSDIDDFQASTFTGSGFNLQNAGSISSRGLELEATWLASTSTEASLGLTKNLARFDSFERGTCRTAYMWHTDRPDPGNAGVDVPYCDRSGDRVGFEPQTKATLAISQHLELGGYDSTFSLDVQYTGDLYLDDTNDPFKYSEAYTLINARWRWLIPQWDASLTVWSRNLLNQEYLAKNGFDAPVQPGKVMAYPGEPRTFGISVSKQF